ncbi:MAG: 2-C-methyl-D-erythritol 4-phosphate cytidylyltransferase [Bacteroidetes bacterium GWF2_42_66]|nr:MAG: 2-C-methyl-D-erythritol 4-phosphate cytidylyltransferase [Bacteroidetes bacterium GWA2_42_15]OFX98493.1 MAG: 2-C-methyl-D-erythritol 4-phosphate cytidylyltransferase [Bacteroidetes bacterium GWE2_42_39]OFY42878.1 MAG: 2-C-methyl-D-erythritol 4-phosphate cytidylyltransferase [Bacteroidetes bacterium GWF2_42_66]HBL75325.1 2-C-methyl-D-erythritol 4-phosphate cytidylyltransferase [Prolixibacteraceae bacterium]HCR91478.1 2-C-methyl-D-erythritol 4-phosphate cytidylyltransferase [Prolixibacter
MKKFALIVAGGMGSRMGNSLPKQFIDLLGEPILMHTIRVFHHFDAGMKIIVVLPENQKLKWKELCSQNRFAVPHQLAAGGENRFESVKNGLKAIDEEGIVFIHDGVRPLVSRETLVRCFETALKYGNAIPVLPVTESLRKQEGEINISVDRSLYVSVQTPQTFRSGQILDAFTQNYDPAFTDDASVAEKSGYKINMVEGNRENIKITTPTDLIVAEAFLTNRS